MIWSSRNWLKTPEPHATRKEIKEAKNNTPETPCKVPPLRFYLMRFCAVLFLEWMSSRSLLDVVHTNIIIFADCDYEVVFLSTQPGSEILQLNINCSCAVIIQYTGSIRAVYIHVSCVGDNSSCTTLPSCLHSSAMLKNGNQHAAQSSKLSWVSIPSIQGTICFWASLSVWPQIETIQQRLVLQGVDRQLGPQASTWDQSDWDLKIALKMQKKNWNINILKHHKMAACRRSLSTDTKLLWVEKHQQCRCRLAQVDSS